MRCLLDSTEALLDISKFRSFQGRNADALALYFGEDPTRCPFEEGIFGLTPFAGFISAKRFFQPVHNCRDLLKKKE